MGRLSAPAPRPADFKVQTSFQYQEHQDRRKSSQKQPELVDNTLPHRRYITRFYKKQAEGEPEASKDPLSLPTTTVPSTTRRLSATRTFKSRRHVRFDANIKVEHSTSPIDPRAIHAKATADFLKTARKINVQAECFERLMRKESKSTRRRAETLSMMTSAIKNMLEEFSEEFSGELSGEI